MVGLLTSVGKGAWSVWFALNEPRVTELSKAGFRVRLSLTSILKFLGSPAVVEVP
jgi:hypothetical protein